MAAPKPDLAVAKELFLFFQNNEYLYNRRYPSFVKNLQRKIARGVYDREKAVKLFLYLADETSLLYTKEFGDGKRGHTADVPTRIALAKFMRYWFEEEYGLLPRVEVRDNPASDAQLIELVRSLDRLKKDRDEMLVGYDIKKRKGGLLGNDYVVILKFRGYVEGRRVYSAGLKSKSRIENAIWPSGGRIIGSKRKRIGNSDFMYEAYGVRFGKIPYAKRGSLFDNAKKHSGTIWKLQFTDTIGGVADVKESIDGGKYQVATFNKKSEAQAEAKELRKLGHGIRIVPLGTPSERDIYENSRYRMPTTAAQERAEKIAKMRKEGLEPLPYGLEKATLRQLQMLGHGDSIWSKKWGMRVKRVR